ncbi:hypothetical protein Rhe02_53610 [Rhizocola hellebori]|uniref:histidine kinase n=2 Tax=Rhizocola hellebori TaxID=1392758 RepID=A0A8J3QCE6_9ACTN|nr:hypothetical protein Rhe02_53610 [Rhizocola hellebori]
MEREERDPDRLAALFRLDHLAARMRRNDENLLVLAGGQARRKPGVGMSLDALVLAALSEIEQYQRIRVEVDSTVRVGGQATGDLVHLLAELFDNAAAFSPPDSPVRVLSTAHGGGVTIEISDEGIGLSPVALTEANQLLGTPPDLNLDSSERMGLVVVSHLAARHRVRVQLRSGHAGTSAYVRVPDDLLIDEGALA